MQLSSPTRKRSYGQQAPSWWASLPKPRLRHRRRKRLEPQNPEIEQARIAVIIGGLPEEAVRAAEKRGPLDWRPLAAALDSLYVAKGGSVGVRMFLTSPQQSLSGLVPVELIANDGDLRRVAHAAYGESVRSDLSRTG